MTELNNNNNNNNSRHIYLRGKLTAQRPITKLAQLRRNNNETRANKIQKKEVYTVAVIITIIIYVPCRQLQGKLQKGNSVDTLITLQTKRLIKKTAARRI
jgi:hypothetical protein